jgi:organic hydroperoxide reductase OsmC/OhrA
MASDAISATAEGFNEMVDRIPLLRRIHVRYELTIPAGSREKADRALAGHVDKCPTARSLKGAVEVTWEATIREAAG